MDSQLDGAEDLCFKTGVGEGLEEGESTSVLLLGFFIRCLLNLPIPGR